MDPLQEPIPQSPAEPLWHPRPKFQNRVWLHVLLFVLTIATTTLAGLEHYLAFQTDFGASTVTLHASLVWYGLFYSVTILAILGCHELGHYFACRYYDVDASLPYFLPLPPIFLLNTGTLGAFIRIRERIPTKAMLFDIGFAGPAAGFIVAVPALFLGVSLSHVARLPEQFRGFQLGEPLLFKLVSNVVWGTIPDGYSINMHPIAFGAWFGLIATAINLVPAWQTDGGHISYAVFGRRSIYLTAAMVTSGIVLSFFTPNWILWTVLIIGVMVFFGPRHPPTLDEHEPLDTIRRIIAVLALAMFVLCFTPAPISVFDLLGK